MSVLPHLEAKQKGLSAESLRNNIVSINRQYKKRGGFLPPPPGLNTSVLLILVG